MSKHGQHKSHAAASHAHKADAQHEEGGGLMSEALLAKRFNLHRKIVGKEGTGHGTTILTIAKDPDDVVVPEGIPGSADNYVVGLEERFWVKEVSEDGRTVVGVVNVNPEAFFEHNFDTAVLNAGALPASLQKKVLEHETKARIIGLSIVQKNPDIVGDEAQTTRIMIGLGRRFGGDFGMHGHIVNEAGHPVLGGSFVVDEADDRVLFTNVDLRPDDLKGCSVILTPLAPPAGQHKAGHHKR